MGREEQLQRAIFYFKGYLKNEPFSPMGAHIEKEIKNIEQEIAELRKPPPFYKKWWFWSIVGGVVVSGAVAGITAVALTPEDQQAVV
ncbi:MAG: hypothetical protein JRH20_24100, partial [Deltaproteobacteria bacterium]|nr:hypothetical protein [Deltaproteobacteria bacterium]